MFDKFNRINKKMFTRLGILALSIAFGIFYSFYKPIRYGLDLKGGVSILLEATSDEGNVTLDSMEKLYEIMERRVNSLGVAEPVIQIVGSNKLSIEIPGVSNTEEAIDMVGKTALLEFRIKDADGTLGEPLMTGKDLIKAEVSYDSGMPAIAIQFSVEGAKSFYKVTRDNVGRELAITLDGELQSAPTIKVAISDGKAVISGNFSYEAARKLALLLSSGSLPLKVNVAEVKIVSATLGLAAIESSLKAGMWAMLFIIAYMILWYFLPGLIASISLVIFGILSLGVMNFLNATLTLPGIAGFILSLGMAVDANVIIFAMIREEIERGITPLAAIKSGFKRSLTSIIDSNVTTLIVTLVLFILGTGSVKGYAVTLSIGVLVSMFSAIFVTRLLLELFFDKLGMKSNKSFGMLEIKFKGSVTKSKKIIYGISLVCVALSCYSIITKGFNYGVDFTGGSLFELKFDQKLDQDKLNTVVNTFNKDLKAQIQFSGDDVAILKTVELNSDDRDDLYSHLRKNCGKFSIEKEESIGAAVGSMLKKNTIWALVIGSLLILLYIALRFTVVFAVSAILALIHDVVIAIGAISYLGYEVNATFIIAVLTILGYSINDTVIVFDRIRDNMKSNSTLSEVIDLSVRQVFTRSFNTSFTTFLSVLAVLLYGSESLHPFLVTFLFGIIAGTYSSIFLASPLVDSITKK